MSKFYIPSCWVTFLPRKQEIVLKTLLVFSLYVFFFIPVSVQKQVKMIIENRGKNLGRTVIHQYKQIYPYIQI